VVLDLFEKLFVSRVDRRIRVPSLVSWARFTRR
jgi:hypothetical protein